MKNKVLSIFILLAITLLSSCNNTENAGSGNYVEKVISSNTSTETISDVLSEDLKSSSVVSNSSQSSSSISAHSNASSKSSSSSSNSKETSSVKLSSSLASSQKSFKSVIFNGEGVFVWPHKIIPEEMNAVLENEKAFKAVAKYICSLETPFNQYSDFKDTPIAEEVSLLKSLGFPRINRMETMISFTYHKNAYEMISVMYSFEDLNRKEKHPSPNDHYQVQITRFAPHWYYEKYLNQV